MRCRQQDVDVLRGVPTPLLCLCSRPWIEATGGADGYSNGVVAQEVQDGAAVQFVPSALDGRTERAGDWVKHGPYSADRDLRADPARATVEGEEQHAEDHQAKNEPDSFNGDR